MRKVQEVCIDSSNNQSSVLRPDWHLTSKSSQPTIGRQHLSPGIMALV
jgi:hypothetical protein